MQTAIINFTTEEKTKQEAQGVAKKLGISLSMVLNNYLKHFVRTKTVVFSTDDERRIGKNRLGQTHHFNFL